MHFSSCCIPDSTTTLTYCSVVDMPHTCRHRQDGYDNHVNCDKCRRDLDLDDEVRVKVVPTDGVGPAMWLKPSEVYLLGYKDGK